MEREANTRLSLNANFPQLVEMSMHQVEAFFDAQSRLMHRIEDANDTYLERMQIEARLISELTAKLSASGSRGETLSAWQQWANSHAALLAKDAMHLAQYTQDLCIAGSQAFTGWMFPGAGGQISHRP